jgi:very-short-patch-repair endonuclease
MIWLNKIVSYWYDCIKNEDVLGKDISIHVRTKAVLYPYNRDPFIFNRQDQSIEVSEEKLMEFSEYCTTEGHDVFYGYPLLFYQNTKTKKHMLAPLFMLKINFTQKKEKIAIEKDELYPTCGIQAFAKLGFKTEEIAVLSQRIEEVFRKGTHKNEKELAEKCLQIITEETPLQINEPIDPNQLTNSIKLTKTSKAGLYNKSMVFAGERTVYNIKLLQDLLELKDRTDTEKTALSYLSGSSISENRKETRLLLPFPANEYQIIAMQEIFQNKLSVITGPPGTGKSQFISNLLVNFFLQGKSVLFVSHTNEAVNVVNEKINEQFNNLMLRTGNKGFRQELKGKFNELISDSRRRSRKSINKSEIHKLWDNALKYRDELVKLDDLEQHFEDLHFDYLNIQEDLFAKYNIWSKLKLIARRFRTQIKLLWFKTKLNRLPSKIEIETAIRKFESDFYHRSREYTKDIYINQMIGKGKNVGKAKSFLGLVDSARYGDDSIDSTIFGQALDMLKIWSCTLKSLRNTFPLKANVFDYVIFDEASQVDLPSAAPALYRAKNAIVVGDPMQLTHIAGITKDMDKGLAKSHGLTDKKDIYPQKIRYCDISLYKSAENSLTHKPILLTNHYRSEDQIIALCNTAFYKGHLKIMTTLDYSRYPNNLPLGVHWIECKGEVHRPSAGSKINAIEAEKVKDVFHEVLEKISGTKLSIGIVTPYSRQEDAITKLIIETTPNYKELKEKHKIEVLTAHKFQGAEKDIMIFSLVLTSKSQDNANKDLWFNIYPQILNVALSRAKYLLYIIGDKQFCHKHTCFKNEDCILRKIAKTYDEIKKQEKAELYTIKEKIDSPTERFLLDKLLEVNFGKFGYKLIPKLVCKRYTLDFALVGKKNIDIECDGSQHEIIKGLPVIEDVERDEFLKKEGWTIKRFSNHRILSDIDNVINETIAALEN